MSKKIAEAFTPIYRTLVERYRVDIQSLRLKSGERIHSITEMQALHHVSRETAKLVLKQLADMGLIVQQRGKGSFVADLRKRKKVWGVVIPFHSVQYETLVGHIRALAQQAGRTVTPFFSYNNWREEVRLVGWMISECYEAAIVIPTLDESQTADFYRRLTSPMTVVCLMDHTMTGSFFSYVIQSYDLGVRRGLQYLADCGVGRIAFVRNAAWIGRNLVQEVMEETYLEFVERSEHTPIIIENFASLSASMITSEKISAVFCCDDTDAVRLVGYLKEQGVSIPGALRIVSYGNTDYARFFTPALTSIDGDLSGMAAKTVEIIKMKLDGLDTSNHQYVIQPQLVIRNT